MKTNNKKKIVVSTLALAMGAALAGSVSGSVAWYQYSTRSVAEFQGVATHCTENLQIRIRPTGQYVITAGDDLGKVFEYADNAFTEVAIPANHTFADNTARDNALAASIVEGQFCKVGDVYYQLVSGNFEDVTAELDDDEKAAITKEYADTDARDAGRDNAIKEGDLVKVGAAAPYTYSKLVSGAFVATTAAEAGFKTAASVDALKTIAEETGWKSDLELADIRAYLTSIGKTDTDSLLPVTSGAFDGTTGVAEKFYRQPVYQEVELVEADANSYVSLPLELRVLDVDGKDEKSFLAKPIYITDLTMAAAKDSGADATNALRVGLSAKVNGASTFNMTLSKENYATTGLKAYGELDLNKSGDIDQTKNYSWEDRETIVYGLGTALEMEVGTTLVYENSKLWKVEIADNAPADAGLDSATYANETAREAAKDTADAGLYKVGDVFWQCEKVDDDSNPETPDVNAWTNITNEIKSLDEDKMIKSEGGEKYFKYNGTAWNEVNLTEQVIKSVQASTKVSAEPQVGVIADNNGLLGTTAADKNLSLDMKVYLEGWNLLAGSSTAVWAENIPGAKFNVGIRFSTTLHETH